jgi:hypothetical protein
MHDVCLFPFAQARNNFSYTTVTSVEENQLYKELTEVIFGISYVTSDCLKDLGPLLLLN